MNRAAHLVSVAVVALAVGCSSTALQQSWKDPGATAILPAGKVLAVAISKNPALRRAAEDEMVRLIGPENATASYSLLGEGDLRNSEAARAKVERAGFTYAFTLRPVSKSQELSWSPGSPAAYPRPYRGFWGYYGWGWGAYYDPGYVRTDTILQVETILYSLADDKVIWAGVTKTTNPTNAEKLVREIAAAAAKDMRKQGLLPPK